MVSEKAAVCVRAERVLNGCCHVWPVYAAVAFGRAWRVEAAGKGKKKCVARRERRVVWCSVNMCGGRHVKMGCGCGCGSEMEVGVCIE